MSIFQRVSCTASRTFWPFLPIASESWSSGTITSIERFSSSTMIRTTCAGASAATT